MKTKLRNEIVKKLNSVLSRTQEINRELERIKNLPPLEFMLEVRKVAELSKEFDNLIAVADQYKNILAQEIAEKSSIRDEIGVKLWGRLTRIELS